MSGYAVFLCFGAGAWQLSDVVPDHLDFLNSMSVNLLGLIDINFFYEFPDDFGREFLHLGVLLYQCKELIHI